MNSRLLRTLIVVAAGSALAWWLVHRRQMMPAVVRIEDGKTIDFSSGNPVVKDSPEEKAIIAKAVKEMDDAAKDVTFPASAPAAAPKK